MLAAGCSWPPPPSSLVAAQMSNCCCCGRFLTAWTIIEEEPTPEDTLFCHPTVDKHCHCTRLVDRHCHCTPLVDKHCHCKQLVDKHCHCTQQNIQEQSCWCSHQATAIAAYFASCGLNTLTIGVFHTGSGCDVCMFVQHAAQQHSLTLMQSCKGVAG